MTRSLPLWVCLLCLSVVCCVGNDVSAQVADHSHRLQKLYDFEDTDDRGNKIGYSSQLLPRNWYVIGRKVIGADDRFRQVPLHQLLQDRKGYPNYSDVGFDRNIKSAGDFSLRLALSGGKTGAYIQHGSIDVKAESDYRVTAKVYTHKLQHAWAELRAYFVDQEGNPVPGSIKRSEPITSEQEWSTISVKLNGDFATSAYIGIELLIIQPGMNADDPIGAHQVVPADITGGAWFDDVAVWELPSVSLSTGVPTNIITAPDNPKLRARVRDLTGKKMRAVIDVYDHNYQVVDRVEDDIEKEGWSWQPDLAGRYGWYMAELKIYEIDARNLPTTQVARTLAGFLWQPPDRAGGGDGRSRFMLLAEDVPTDHLPLIQQLMSQTKLSGLVVSAWEKQGTPDSTAERARVLEPILRDLIVRQGQVAVSFWPVPVELAGRVGVDAADPLNVLTVDAGQWIDYAKPFLAPLGQRLSNWQVGTSSKPLAYLAHDLAADVEAARKGIRTTAPNPRLVLPWRLDQYSRTADLSPQDSYAVAWPQGVTPANLKKALADFPAPPTNVRLDIELADAQDMSQHRRIADLMLRVLHAWELQPGAIGLAKPWAEASERRLALTPDPVLGAWLNLADQLEGQRVVARMPLGPGLDAMILDGQQGGMLAVWNQRHDQDPVDLQFYLGQSPIAVDPFGNQTPMVAQAGKHNITVTSTPTIIRQVDVRLALLRAGMSLDQPFIQSHQIGHRRILRIKNPWPRTLNGFYTVVGPDKWTIQPKRKHISIAPGDTAEIPIALRFPIHEDGGHKSLKLDFMFNVGKDYDVTLTVPMELGLEGVEFDASVIVEPGKTPGTTDAIVTLNVTNTSDAKQSLNLFSGMQGQARREIIIPGIAPGEFVSRRIRFKDVGKQVGRSPVRCGVRESNGPAVLNKTIDLISPRQADDREPPIVEVPTP